MVRLYADQRKANFSLPRYSRMSLPCGPALARPRAPGVTDSKPANLKVGSGIIATLANLYSMGDSCVWCVEVEQLMAIAVEIFSRSPCCAADNGIR